MASYYLLDEDSKSLTLKNGRPFLLSYEFIMTLPLKVLLGKSWNIQLQKVGSFKKWIKEINELSFGVIYIPTHFYKWFASKYKLKLAHK